jgi:hypothetical protein
MAPDTALWDTLSVHDLTPALVQEMVDYHCVAPVGRELPDPLIDAICRLGAAGLTAAQVADRLAGVTFGGRLTPDGTRIGGRALTVMTVRYVRQILCGSKRATLTVPAEAV